MEYNNRLFNELKSIKETLDDRYTSGQLVSTLDDLLYRACKPLIKHTTMADEFASILLSWYSGASRRKISRLTKTETIEQLGLFLLTTNKIRLRIFRDIGLERNLLFFMLAIYIEKAERYTQLEYRMLKTKSLKKRARLRLELRSISLEMGQHQDYPVAPDYYEVKLWHDQACRFRNQILEKYTRHILNKASAYYRSLPKVHADRTDLSDLIQNYMLTANKALSKFDSNSGTLTSYINDWLRGAHTGAHFEHEYGIAYQFPETMRRTRADRNSVNIYVSIDKHNKDDHDDDEPRTSNDKILMDTETPQIVNERTQQIERVRYLARHADPIGLARLSLGIEEQLSPEEIKRIKSENMRRTESEQVEA